MSDASTAAATRGARRRAQTRERLVEAARSLFAERGVELTRIQEITDRADVGFGSFYNHFADKDAIVAEVLRTVTDRLGDQLDELTQAIEDPAEVIAVSHRHFVRLAEHDPTWGWLVIRFDIAYHALRDVLGPRAVRDLQRGIASSRFAVPEPVTTLQATGATLLGTIRGILDGTLPEGAGETQAELVLRLLGLDHADAAEVARRPLPELPDRRPAGSSDGVEADR